MKKPIYDKEKAARVYRINSEETQKRYQKELQRRSGELADINAVEGSQFTGMFIELVENRIKEDIEIYAQALVNTIANDKKINDKTKSDLIQESQQFLDSMVEQEKWIVKQRIAGMPGAVVQGQLSSFHNRCLGIRNRLEDKIAVQIDQHNDHKQATFVKKIKEALPSVIAQKVIAGLVFLILIFLGVAVPWVCQRAPRIEI